MIIQIRGDHYIPPSGTSVSNGYIWHLKVHELLSLPNGMYLPSLLRAALQHDSPLKAAIDILSFDMLKWRGRNVLAFAALI